jgi:hypothetical protein
MRMTPLIGTVAAAALGVRLARARRQRALHPLGRSMAGELRIWGCPEPVGAELVDVPGRYPVIVRLSKGLGTRRDRPDVRGLAIRVPGQDRPFDLLLSTVGPGRWGRRLPMPRRTFDAEYGSIAAYRAGGGRVYLAAGPDREPVGDDIEQVGRVPAELLLYVVRDSGEQAFGRVRFGGLLDRDTDAALAFDPIRNSSPDLHPTGLLHGVRAVAYKASRRWRGATLSGQDCKAT